MNRIRRLAEELVEKYPQLFSVNFDSNKKALGEVATVRSTSIRNQLAGAITNLVKERSQSGSTPSVEITEAISASSDTADQKDGDEVQLGRQSAQVTTTQAAQ